MQSWLHEMEGALRPASFHMYDYQVQHYILPLLGDTPLDQISSETADELRSELRQRELSPYLVKDVSSRFSQALRWGASKGYDLPVLKNKAVQRKKGIRTLTSREQALLMAGLAGEKESLINSVLLAWKAGLTTGELCGLKWQDVDREKNTLTVRRICQRLPEGVEYCPVDERTVPLPENLRGNETLGWVLRTTRDGAAEPRLCSIWLRDYVKKVGLSKDITYAVLRNTYIRDLMESGTDFIKISRLTGNKDLNDLWRKFGEYYKGGEGL